MHVVICWQILNIPKENTDFPKLNIPTEKYSYFTYNKLSSYSSDIFDYKQKIYEWLKLLRTGKIFFLPV